MENDDNNDKTNRLSYSSVARGFLSGNAAERVWIKRDASDIKDFMAKEQLFDAFKEAGGTKAFKIRSEIDVHQKLLTFMTGGNGKAAVEIRKRWRADINSKKSDNKKKALKRLSNLKMRLKGATKPLRFQGAPHEAHIEKYTRLTTSTTRSSSRAHKAQKEHHTRLILSNIRLITSSTHKSRRKIHVGLHLRQHNLEVT